VLSGRACACTLRCWIRRNLARFSNVHTPTLAHNNRTRPFLLPPVAIRRVLDGHSHFCCARVRARYFKRHFGIHKNLTVGIVQLHPHLVCTSILSPRFDTFSTLRYFVYATILCSHFDTFSTLRCFVHTWILCSVHTSILCLHFTAWYSLRYDRALCTHRLFRDVTPPILCFHHCHSFDIECSYFSRRPSLFTLLFRALSSLFRSSCNTLFHSYSGSTFCSLVFHTVK